VNKLKVGTCCVLILFLSSCTVSHHNRETETHFIFGFGYIQIKKEKLPKKNVRVVITKALGLYYNDVQNVIGGLGYNNSTTTFVTGDDVLVEIDTKNKNIEFKDVQDEEN